MSASSDDYFVCPHCGAALPDDAHFCPECGASDDSGWRRESYDVRSTPADPTLRRRFTASDYLERGR